MAPNPDDRSPAGTAGDPAGTRAAGDPSGTRAAGDPAAAGDPPGAPARVVPDELTHPFAFERKRRSLRSAEAARPGVKILLSRLDVPSPGRALRSDKAFERQLLLFGTEVLLNIDYYGGRTRREERKQWAMNAGIYGLALVFVGFAVYVFVDDRAAAVAASAQIAAVVGAVLAGVKFLTESQDFQKTRSSFWEAGAELKERLYLFIGEWSGRAWDAKRDRFAPEFVIALQHEIKRARDIQTEERRRFYDLMATPTRLMGATQQLSGEAQAAVSSYVQANQLRDEQRRLDELEQITRHRDGLYEMYPDDEHRPAAVVARLTELDTRARVLSGEASITSVAAAVATAVTPTPTPSPSSHLAVPFDGRREP